MNTVLPALNNIKYQLYDWNHKKFIVIPKNIKKSRLHLSKVKEEKSPDDCIQNAYLLLQELL